MTALFLKIVNMSITASWLIAAVLLLRLLLKSAPKWSHVLLWGIVAVRLLFPFSIESALSLTPSTETISPEIMMDATPTIDSGIPILNQTVNPIISQVFEPAPFASANPLQIWIPVCSVIWLIGIVVLLLYATISYWCLHRRVRTAVRLEAPAVQHHGPTPPVCSCHTFQSERVLSPFVLGILRPRIYLPFGMDSVDQELVIAHEQAHIQRHDHWWKPLGFLLLTIHWFNPLMWLAYVLLCRDIEMACDAKVVQSLHYEQRADYSQALLNLSIHSKRISACPLAYSEGSVKNRVKSVLHYKKPALWIMAASIIACAAMAVCFLTDPLAPYDSLRLTERNDSTVHYDIELGHETMSGTLYAEQWVNGTCVRSAPVSMTQHVKEIQIYMNERRDNGTLVGVDVQINTDQYGGSLLTYFELPMDPPTLGWSFTAYEMNDTVKITTGTEKILAAMALDTGNGVRAYDCETLINEPERLQTASSMIVVRACWDTEPVPVQAEEPTADPAEVLRLQDVITLAEKGYDLTWADFAHYDYYETGSGLYIRVYPIDDTFSLWIGGAGPDSEPFYIYLSTNDDQAASIDIRGGHVKEYIADPVRMTQESITALFEVLESSPLTASAPAAYIEAHDEEYQQLIAYDKHTLRYCFEQFLEGGQDGLHGRIMASVCQAIIANYEDAFETAGAQPATGQEWFDRFLHHAEARASQHDEEDLQAMYPMSWMLLEMMSE